MGTLSPPSPFLSFQGHRHSLRVPRCVVPSETLLGTENPALTRLSVRLATLEGSTHLDCPGPSL